MRWVNITADWAVFLQPNGRLTFLSFKVLNSMSVKLYERYLNSLMLYVNTIVSSPSSGFLSSFYLDDVKCYQNSLASFIFENPQKFLS